MSMIKDPNYIFGAVPEPVKTPDDHSALWLGIAAALGVGLFILMKDSKQETVNSTLESLEPKSETTAEESIAEALDIPEEPVKKKKRKSSKLS